MISSFIVSPLNLLQKFFFLGRVFCWKKQSCVATVVFNVRLLHAVAFSDLKSHHENAKVFQHRLNTIAVVFGPQIISTRDLYHSILSIKIVAHPCSLRWLKTQHFAFSIGIFLIIVLSFQTLKTHIYA